MRVCLAVIAAVAVAEPRPAAACSCSLPEATLSAHPRAVLPIDPTLYLFEPDRDRHESSRDPREPVVAVQDGRLLEVDDEQVLDDGHRIVRRLRIRGTRPGTIEVRYQGDKIARYRIAPREAMPSPQLRSVRYEQPGRHCSTEGFTLALSGTDAAAYRLEWRLADGTMRRAYVPVWESVDVNGLAQEDHEVVLGETACGPTWLDIEWFQTLTPEVTLTMLTYGGEERVVARGPLYLGKADALMPTFERRESPPVAPVAAPPPPRPDRTWASWAALGIAIGIVLGASAMSLDVLRRRG